MTASNAPAAVVILAAGLGTRMQSDRAKVLHAVRGAPMILHVVATAVALVPADHVVVVVGHQADTVRRVVSERHPVRFALQAEQLGTGHAVRCALPALPPATADVIILCGDVPMLRPATVDALLAAHRQADNAVTVLAVELQNPTGYGRILHDPEGRVTGIVEEADADADQRALRLVNSGIYCVRCGFLAQALGRVAADNAQGEYYLTDIVAIARQQGRRIGLSVGAVPAEVAGVNTLAQLAAVDAAMRAVDGKTA